MAVTASAVITVFMTNLLGKISRQFEGKQNLAPAPWHFVLSLHAVLCEVLHRRRDATLNFLGSDASAGAANMKTESMTQQTRGRRICKVERNFVGVGFAK
jgi:hypothetical protein